MLGNTNFFKSPYQVFLTLSILMISLCLLSFIYFDIGLFFDGSHFLFVFLQDESFGFFEKSRKTFQFFQQFPVWLFLHGTDSSSLPAVINLYSFGLIWIHIPALFLCYFILPAWNKLPFIFPLIAFFTGPLTAFNISKSVALSVGSYLWAVAFIIYYSNLSLKSHRVLLFLSILPLFQSHELMSYMSLFFILLCFLKTKKEKIELNRYLILACICFFIFLFGYHSFDLFYLDGDIFRIDNRRVFLSSVFGFQFLFKGYELNLLILIAILLKIFLIIELFIKKHKLYLFLGLSIFLLFLKFSFFSYFTLNLSYSFMNARFYPPLISLPFCLLIWIIYEEKFKAWKPSNSFLLLCFLAFISLTFFRIQWDFNFYKNTQKFTNYLSTCQGILYHSNLKWINEDYIDTGKLPSKSLFFPKKRDIDSIIIGDLYCNKVSEKDLFSQKEAKDLCNALNLYFPQDLLESNFELKQRFFNFEPVYLAYKKGVSNCSNSW